MSRKTFFWFELAFRLFPNASYIAKGDDDMFLRVPQYLADLRSLPRRGLYWGIVAMEPYPVEFWYAFGACYTLARDAVEQLVSFLPLVRLVSVPYTSEWDAEYHSLMMQAEDAMVGLALEKMGYRGRLIFVSEGRCAFHDVHNGPRLEPVRPSSVMIHHVREGDYNQLMERFGGGTVAVARKLKRSKKRRLDFSC
ncbi:putative UDP-Gal or UDP-GlcNAc-dependent glycosyltransferase [Trypanosoma grayi]|uniref:putative UDP-Gal or UDP-GlcNAc-dependent glycosyltransferase n=1 Tax=Trypanosoma grayi TaxID=71804 RepID=UPI0004F4231F|nr:putative UDP-Gal or UDP-GlcNAc-dependent glycosyltransferase [Trypanosoma grayi]KEG05788.1 putative UDP-Gal or UDP-GlcNAc-dependent glycosyltransferase [Trypanosoma grayi]